MGLADPMAEVAGVCFTWAWGGLLHIPEMDLCFPAPEPGS